jgi:tRNA-splicing ligase RtcB
MSWQDILRKIDDFRWEIPQDYKPGMRVPGLIFSSEAMLEHLVEEQVYEQVANVAFLPGIVGRSLAMPDIHWGYGFPIGGVAATRTGDGVISPGGVGFDINCGVRLLRTNMNEEEVRPKIKELVEGLFRAIPSGVGSSGRIKVSAKELDEVMVKGSRWAIERGLGEEEDIILTEEQGCLKGANPDKVSRKAKERGLPQLGTLGSGNHFLEVGRVDEIYEPDIGRAMGIENKGQIVIWIHTGSRGLGHQVCTDYLDIMARVTKKLNINLPDRQLACAPLVSEEGRNYLQAMAASANYAWANRQCIAHWIREVFSRVYNKSSDEMGIRQVYDVAHNIAKIELHIVDGRRLELCVHRKGATRAFPKGHPMIPDKYKDIGQPVLIPGDMGRYSFIAIGTDLAMKETFGSTCHGAGRLKSRAASKRQLKGSDVASELARRGITVMAESMGSLAEEASSAYKDVSDVVEVTQQAGISCKVARTSPIGVIKG